MAHMKNIKQKKPLCIGVVINRLSLETLDLLGTHFKQLERKLEILLIRHIPSLPPVFYQLSKMNDLMHEQVKEANKELYWAETGFQISVIRQIFIGASVLHILRQFPEIDHLIGNGLGKGRLFSKPQGFIGDVQAWIEEYGANIDANGSYDPKCSSETTEASGVIYPLHHNIFMMRDLKEDKPKDHRSIEITKNAHR